MKIEKFINYNDFYYYYVDAKTDNWIWHGLYNDYSWWGIGYHYHGTQKGFWLEKKIWL